MNKKGRISSAVFILLAVIIIITLILIIVGFFFQPQQTQNCTKYEEVCKKEYTSVVMVGKVFMPMTHYQNVPCSEHHDKVVWECISE